MRKLRFSRFLLISVVTVTFVASLIFFLLRDVKIRKSFSQNLSNVSVTLSSLISYPVSTVKNFIFDFKSLDEVREENSKLKERLLSLEPHEEKLKDLTAENESLKASLGVKNIYENQEVLTGKVISRSTIAWLDWVSLDIGKKQDVSENMLVLSNGYLVGTISQVTSYFSTVNLLTNTDNVSEIPVKISTNSGDVYGILSGFDLDKNTFIVTKLNKKLDVSKDATVFTSGLDGKSAANVKVGKVLDIVSEDELNRTVYVSPGADFDHLTYVTLLGE